MPTSTSIDIVEAASFAQHVQPFVHLEPGESLQKKRGGRIADRYFLGFAPDFLNDILTEAPPSVSRLVLWAVTHLVIGTNLVGARPISHHSPTPQLATPDTLAADLQRSASSLRRDLKAADELNIWATLSFRSVSHFLVNPQLAWRGDTSLRANAIAFYQQVRADPRKSTMDNVVSFLALLRQK